MTPVDRSIFLMGGARPPLALCLALATLASSRAATADEAVATTPARPVPSVIRGVGGAKPGVAPLVFEGDLHDLAPAPGWQPGDRTVDLGPHAPSGRSAEATPKAASRTGGRAGSANGPARFPGIPSSSTADGTVPPPILNFDGLEFTSAYPPDPVGDVGADWYVQAVNSITPLGAGTVVMVHDKATGAELLAPPRLLSSMWDLVHPGVPSACNSAPHGDPIVLWDKLASRWILTEIVAPEQPHLCVYVSQTENPLAAGWCRVPALPVDTFC